MRDETEWMETVEAGWNMTVSTSQEKIRQAFERFIESPPPTTEMQPYGKGDAAEKIIRTMLDH